MNEFKRIFLSRKILFTWLMALFLCGVFFAYECNSNKDITFSGEELQGYLDSYPDFLQSVRDNATGVGMLAAISDNTGFTQDNINRTLADYSRLEGVELIYGENKGIVIFSNFVIGDGVILAIVLAVLLQFAEEKSKGLILLVRSTQNGRSRLTLERAGILAVTALLASFWVTTVCMILSHMLCGAADLSRPLQSVPEFSLCALPITIGQYLMLTVLLKVLAAFSFGLLVLLLLVWLEAIPAVLLGGGAMLGELLLYTLILGTDKLSGFKLANIIALLRSEIFFKHYYNVNLFGHAVGFLLFSTVVIGVLAAGLVLFATICSAKCTELNLELGFLGRIKVWLSIHAPNPPLFFWELKKVFIGQKGILILAAIIYFAASSGLEYKYYYYLNEEREYYYEKYAGTITQEKVSEMQATYDEKMQLYLSKCSETDNLWEQDPENEKLISLYQDCYDIGQDLIALEVVIENATGALNYTLETGAETQLVKPDAYEMLFVSDTGTTDKNSMFILLGIIGLFSGLMACEKESNMNVWLHTLFKGRRPLLLAKMGILALTTPVLVLSISAAQLYQVADAVGFNNLNATAQSIALFREIPLPISIGGYLMLTYALRICFAFLIGLLIMLISHLTPNRVMCLFVSFVLLVVPMVLALTGIVEIFSAADLLGVCCWIG